MGLEIIVRRKGMRIPLNVDLMLIRTKKRKSLRKVRDLKKIISFPPLTMATTVRKILKRTMRRKNSKRVSETKFIVKSLMKS